MPGWDALMSDPALACAAEILQAPVATSVSGKGVIPDAHPLAVGWGYGAQGTRAAEKAFKEVDVVLAVGVKYSGELDRQLRNPACHGKVIHVDACASNNIGRNVETCVKVNADSRVFFDRLVRDADAVRRPNNPGLVRKIAHSRDVDRRENGRTQITQGVDPMTFLMHLRCALGPDELIFVDVTGVVALGGRGDRPRRPPALLHPGEQSEHGLGDRRLDRRPAGPTRSSRRLDLGGWLLPHVGPGDVDCRTRQPAGPVLRSR